MSSIDVARATVGALLMLPTPSCRELLAVLRDDDPDDPRLRVILRLARELVAEDRQPDPVAVLAHAQASGSVKRSEQTAVALLLTELVSLEGCPLPAAAGWYAASLVESATRRRVTEAAERLRFTADSSTVDGLDETVRVEAVEIVAAVDRLRTPVVIGGGA